MNFKTNFDEVIHAVPHWLYPNDMLTFEITFEPSSEGLKEADLIIFTNDGIAPEFNIPMSGFGILDGDPIPSVLFATESMWLQQRSSVLSGDVWVNSGDEGELLAERSALAIGQRVEVNSDSVMANSIVINQRATVNANVHYNELDNDGSIEGELISPLDPLPIVNPENMPEFPEFQTSDVDIEVGQDGVQLLVEGEYGELLIRQGGTVILGGGEYTFESIDCRNSSNLLFEDASNVCISNKLRTDNSTIVAPAEEAEITAKDIIFYVEGENGNNGRMNNSPKAVDIGQDNEWFANVYAPNGTIQIGQESNAEGSFISKWIILSQSSTVQYDGAFNYSGDMIASRDTGVSLKDGSYPQTSEITGIYPNPFNSRLSIRYNLHEASDVSLKMFDASGRIVKTFVEGNTNAGQYIVVWDGRQLASGLYFIHFSSRDILQIRKVVMIK